ncbi:MAG TPA: hypothetical protein VG309_04555 [Rhizomicrobium sp.]|jgi:hypothetical protein|nr:hypothetical protein [Rhizomicrobium sp.]
MGAGNTDDVRRYGRIALSIAATLVLVGCGGLGLLPYQTDIQNTKFHSYKQVVDAYEQIQPGVTRVSDLGTYGFDAASSPNVEMLSYLGVIERFMPRDSIKFDALDPAVQDCIDARDRCTAFVFRPERLHQERTGNWFLDVLGFERTTVNYGWSAEVMLLVEDGRVAYKVISGKPNIQDYHDKVAPLGPFQDLGNAVVHVASSAANL